MNLPCHLPFRESQRDTSVPQNSSLNGRRAGRQDGLMCLELLELYSRPPHLHPWNIHMALVACIWLSPPESYGTCKFCLQMPCLLAIAAQGGLRSSWQVVTRNMEGLLARSFQDHGSRRRSIINFVAGLSSLPKSHGARGCGVGALDL